MATDIVPIVVVVVAMHAVIVVAIVIHLCALPLPKEQDRGQNL